MACLVAEFAEDRNFTNASSSMLTTFEVKFFDIYIRNIPIEVEIRVETSESQLEDEASI